MPRNAQEIVKFAAVVVDLTVIWEMSIGWTEEGHAIQQLHEVERQLAARADHRRSDLDQLYTKRDQLRLGVISTHSVQDPPMSVRWRSSDTRFRAPLISTLHDSAYLAGFSGDSAPWLDGFHRV